MKMDRNYNVNKEDGEVWSNKKLAIYISAGSLAGLVLLISLIFGVSWIYRKYNIWSMEMQGRAELAQAEYSRKIAIFEAEAKKDAAKYLAEAEIIKAEGIAKANQIIGDSLKNNEPYLQFKLIESLADNTNKVIYLPNGNLPITESARLLLEDKENKK